MYINNGKPNGLPPGKYDPFIATRTEFDREALQPGEQFDWQFFLNDVFKYAQPYPKPVNAGSAKDILWMRKYLWNPSKETPH